MCLQVCGQLAGVQVSTIENSQAARVTSVVEALSKRLGFRSCGGPLRAESVEATRRQGRPSRFRHTLMFKSGCLGFRVAGLQV